LLAIVASGTLAMGVGGLTTATAVTAAPTTHPSRASRAAAHAAPGVVISNIRLRVPGQKRRVSAYVVRPAGRLPRHSQAGVLFLHWLGDVHSDRTEFLGEAVGLAQQGVVSVLPQGRFPWVSSPDGTSHDVTLVKDQLHAFRRALDALAGMRAVDPKRIGLVGHDYGAMYGSLLADRDHRVSTLVLETPDSLWGNWFATYWLGLDPGPARDAYYAMFDGLDPIDHTSRLGRHVLLQWAGDDVYIPSEVRDAFAAASPDAKVELFDGVDHQLNDAAEVARDKFLVHQLRLH
jgi:dienelactone hydrolase